MAAIRSKTLKMGMVGIGVGGAEILPAMESTPGIELYAGADINPITRERIRKAIQAGTRDEEGDKQTMRIGGDQMRGADEVGSHGPRLWNLGDLGILIAHCERGAIRHSQFGLYVYDDNGEHDVSLTSPAMGGVTMRRGELEELYECLVGNKPMFHDGSWGMATLEVALAIIQSARERKEIMLQHQLAVPDEYDAELPVPTF